MIKVNGGEIVTPSEFQIELSDLDGESNRNAAGLMIRDRITVKRKLVLGWNALNNEQLKSLLEAVTDVFFNVTYYDPLVGKEVTIEAYVGDRVMPMYSCVDDVTAKIVWQSMKMNFIER